MQPSDQCGGLDVAGVLTAESLASDAEGEAECLDVAGQFRVGERDGLPLVQIVKLEGLKIVDENVAGAIPLGQRVEILPSLSVCLAEIAPGALLFDDQVLRPE